MYLLYHAFTLFASLKEVAGNDRYIVDICRIISQEIMTLSNKKGNEVKSSSVGAHNRNNAS